MGRPASVQFGVNVNNREPLIAPEQYSLDDLLRLAADTEVAGFDSVWVGDSLFSKPRWEALSLLSAISQRTQRVKLGTSCLVTSTRDPLYLALEWATLDAISGGRTILGACPGSPEQGVEREFDAVGLDYRKRTSIFEEGLEVLQQLWGSGEVTLHGQHFNYDKISFYSGTEAKPLAPLQTPPPIWVTSNPRLIDESSDERMRKTMRAACRRILRFGQGWLTCCRAQHPEELVEQLGYLKDVADEEGFDMSSLDVGYQVTLTLGESEAEARRQQADYLGQYYPEMSKLTQTENWGPVGTASQVIDWFRTFADAGVTHFICRFASLDQFGHLERFASQILPAFEEDRAIKVADPSSSALSA